MFKQLAEEFVRGTITLTVQVEPEKSMVVMVNFKGIDQAPIVLRGTPEEMDEKFIEMVRLPMNFISDFNQKEYMAGLEKELAEKAKKLDSENKEKEKVKKEEGKKKVDEAKAAQTSLLEEAPVKKPKEATHVKNVANAVENVKAKAEENLKTKPLTEEEINLLKTHLESEEPNPWDAFDFCSKIIAQIRGIKPEEAIDLVNASKVVVEYNKVPEEKKHEVNVEAMKQAMEKEPEDEFVFDAIDAGQPVAVVEEDDDFEL